MKTCALIPAGGLSVRMGRPKLALPLGARTVLERVVGTLRQTGIAPILVVLGPHVANLAPLAESAGAEVALLPTATPDMRATIEHGLRWLEERLRPQPMDAWLLVPADHPTLSASAIQRLLAVRQERPERSILIPTFNGQRGHPTLIAWQQVAGLRALPAGQGLNAYFRRQPDATLEVPVDAPEILVDLDTPADYERLRQSWAAR